MKKISLLLILSALTVSVYSQGWEMFFKVRTKTEPFRVALGRDKVVLCLADSTFYAIDTTAKATDSLQTIIRWGKYTVIGGSSGSGVSGDSLWHISGSYIANIDTTKGLYFRNGDGTSATSITADLNSISIAILDGNTNTQGEFTAFPTEGRTTTYSRTGTKWAQTDLYGLYHSLIASGDTVIDLGLSSNRWGVFYGTSANLTGTVTASGGNSTNWNTAYSSRISSVTGTKPLTLTLGTNTITGSISKASAADSGYLSSTDWNTFNNKVSSQWTTASPGITYNDTAKAEALRSDHIISDGAEMYITAKDGDNYGSVYLSGESNEINQTGDNGYSVIGQSAGSVNFDLQGKINQTSYYFDTTGIYSTNFTTTNGTPSYPWKSYTDSLYGGSADASGMQFFTTSSLAYPTGKFDFNVASQGEYLKKLTINSTGVGVNTVSPGFDLDVTGTAKISSIVGGTAAGSQIIYKSTTGAGTSSGIAHQFKVGTDGGTTAVTILNNGNVGFGGKTNPSVAVEVTGGITSSGTGNFGGTSVMYGGLQGSLDNVWYLKNVSTGTSSAMSFWTKNTEKARIDPSGNLGIGTTAPATKLHVRDGAIRAGVTVRADMDSTIYKLTAAGKGVVISTDSAIRLHGTATVWDDLMMPFTTGENAGTGYPAFNADSLWYNFVIDTVGLTKCIIYMPVQMPNSWKEGSSAVYPHIHYHHTTAQGTPTFKVKYKWVNTGSLTGDWKWLTMATTSGTTNNTHQMCYSTAGISGTGKTISSILLCMIYLTAQTGTGGIDAYQFDIHYEINSLGSNTDTFKN